MSLRLRTFGDAMLAVLLVGVLAVILVVDRKSPEEPKKTGSTPVAVSPPTFRARLAVTQGQHDLMQPLLEKMGNGYKFESVKEDDLLKPGLIEQFDAVFLTCDKGSDNTVAVNERMTRLARVLKDFVSQGGTLYASDLQFDTLRLAFPDSIEVKWAGTGVRADGVKASVVDPDLQKVLGSDTMMLHFDADSWCPAAFSGTNVTEYLRGKFLIQGVQDPIEAPLLVKFKHGLGTVIFTSFHNAKQEGTGRDGDPQEAKLLKYLVNSTVIARVEAEAERELESGGFSPQERHLLSASKENPKVESVYRHTSKGPLVFVLKTEKTDPNAGSARFRLEALSPAKALIDTRDGDTEVRLEIPDAEPGDWTLVVTALEIPYPDFPYKLTVATPKAKSLQGQAVEREPQRPRGPKVEFRIVPNEVAKRTGPLKIGVTEVWKDDMGKLLNGMGAGYSHDTIDFKDLLEFKKIQGFDILFLTCTPYPGEWGLNVIGPAGRPGVNNGQIRPEILESLRNSIRDYVQNGGTLYASDFCVQVLYNAFNDRMPEVVLPSPAFFESLEVAEKRWIKAVAPTSNVATIAETLAKIKLNPPLNERDALNFLIACVQTSSLVEGELGRRSQVKEENIRKEISESLPFKIAKEDLPVIANAIIKWNESIADAFSGRTPAQRSRARAEIENAHMDLQRKRLMIFTKIQGQGPQVVNARFVDPALREALGNLDHISLNFEDTEWRPARFKGNDVIPLLEGDFMLTRGDRITAPLLVKFREGKGTVIFTAFHNQAINNKQQESLLRHVVFTAFGDREVKAAEGAVAKGGFMPAKQRLGAHVRGQVSVPVTYIADKPGRIRIVLTVPREGGELKFRVQAPNGDAQEWTTQSTLIIESSDAPAGEWVSTVTAVRVPFDNFPYGVLYAPLASTK